MKFKNYKGFRIKKIELKQEITDNKSAILWYLRCAKSFSELVNLINSEIGFCDLIGNEEESRSCKKELQKLEEYLIDEF